MEFTIVDSTDKKMTMRDFLNGIIATDGIDKKFTDFAKEEIVKLDNKIAARKGKPAKADEKKLAENNTLKSQILEFLTNKGEIGIAAEIGEVCGITTQKASALLRQLVTDGRLISKEVSVKGKGKVKGYTLA